MVWESQDGSEAYEKQIGVAWSQKSFVYIRSTGRPLPCASGILFG
jgi:hypothetical protein